MPSYQLPVPARSPCYPSARRGPGRATRAPWTRGGASAPA